MALYGGSALFGNSVVCKVMPHESAAQKSAYFGVNGQFNLWGGQRGAMIEVRGVLVADTYSDLSGLIQSIKSCDDGVGRPFVDSYGNVYNNTVFRRYTPAAERVFRTAGGGWAEVYQCTFEYLGG